MNQQEILLVAGNKGNPLFTKEELGQSYWNGLLKEMLPGMILCSSEMNAWLIWEVEPTGNCIWINMGWHPCVQEKQSTIDPCFLPAQNSFN